MIIADFFKASDNKLKGFSVSGHSMTAESGSDICCASVSSAVMLTANLITDAFKEDAKVRVTDNEIKLKLGEDAEGTGDKLVLGLLEHLYFIGEQFPGAVKVSVIELDG